MLAKTWKGGKHQFGGGEATTLWGCREVLETKGAIIALQVVMSATSRGRREVHETWGEIVALQGATCTSRRNKNRNNIEEEQE